MVELLQNEMPAVYELESDWFETLRRQKPAILTSNVRACSASDDWHGFRRGPVLVVNTGRWLLR